jgi:hypothetical protein
MKLFSSLIVLFGVLLSIAFSGVKADADPRYVCSFCLITLGLVEQAAFQVHLERALIDKCGTSKACQLAVKDLISTVEKKAVPEDICKEISLCTDDCKLFSSWPVDPLPPKPPAWPIERRLLEEKEANLQSVVATLETPADHKRDLTLLKPIFESMLVSNIPKEWGIWAHSLLALSQMLGKHNIENFNTTSFLAYPDDCGFNVSCHIQQLIDHKPLQDHDGDYYSRPEVQRLRGSHWRGTDCDDLRSNVYPGRKSSTYGADVDHNCNGIVGGNSTGSYEDIFCSQSSQRGIAILGDSATAHFHIPPQWLTADGWNLNQLLPDAMNEIDMPMCSWGTGHVTAEECPFQYPVPGLQAGVVTSLYSQLRERNRCNHNDFQNIGVNGARVTSSMQLAKALARDQSNDLPLLVWFALIGNDICNGHPDFTHMTRPDEFYEKAMETFNILDTMVPPGSHVVALALFDGELLYQIMHSHVHPLGTKYQQAYDFMNCLEENPCWGWLNSNATVRRISTGLSDALNAVYQVSSFI